MEGSVKMKVFGLKEFMVSKIFSMIHCGRVCMIPRELVVG